MAPPLFLLLVLMCVNLSVGRQRNPEYIVTASHIAVDTEGLAVAIKARIRGGESSFAEEARLHSTCPSGPQGGKLAPFKRGTLLSELDGLVFGDKTPPGEVTGPVKTQHGWHLILIHEREEESNEL